MKTFILTLCIVITSLSVSAQGLVNFANTPSTLITAQALSANGPYSVMSGPAGTYYFALYFTTPTGPIFSGVYATNTGFDGLFSGGTVAVPGWAPGTSTNYVIYGWSAFMGHTFSLNWLIAPGPPGGDVGFSAAGSGVAGDGSSIPALNLFDGGSNTLIAGFRLYNTLVPEPGTAGVAFVGICLILCRHLKRTNKPPNQVK